MSKREPQSYLLVTTNGSDVELADGNESKFKRYWKMLTPYGEWVDPRGMSKPMKHDKNWAEKVVNNFKSGARGYIPVPLGHPQSPAELAENNKGELIDLEARDDGLWGKLEIRDENTAEKIEKKIIPDVSMGYDDDYQDKKTGKWIGPTLKHVGLVVQPYIKGMTEFEPVALADGACAAVLFSEGSVANNGETNKKEENTMETVEVKNERTFDVEVKYTNDEGEQTVTVKAGETVTVPKDQEEAVAKQIADAVDPAENSDNKDEELSEEQKKEKELADREAAIARQEAELAEKQANAEYERLLSEGKIVPAQKDAFIALSSKGSATVELADGVEKTVSVLLAELFEGAAKLNLDEQGNGDKDGDKGDEDKDVELSDEEKSLGDDFGNTPEEIAEFKKAQSESN